MAVVTAATAAAAAAAAAAPAIAPLTLRHFAAALPEETPVEELERAFALFDVHGEGFVTAEAFRAFALALLADLQALRSSLDGSSQSAVAAVGGLATVAFAAVVLLLLLLIWGVELGSVLIPLSTVLVSGSFAVGPTLSSVVQALLLVLVVRPYDVGDRVTLSGVPGGGAPGELLKVERVELLTTSFLTVTNRMLIVPNNSILACTAGAHRPQLPPPTHPCPVTRRQSRPAPY